jgi:uncharacterized BrkB/YihY/UPF0761 family membrane protein
MSLFTLVSLGLVFFIAYLLFLLKLFQQKHQKGIFTNSIEVNTKTRLNKALNSNLFILIVTLIALLIYALIPSDPKPSSQINGQPIEKTIPLSTSRK